MWMVTDTEPGTIHLRAPSLPENLEAVLVVHIVVAVGRISRTVVALVHQVRADGIVLLGPW